MKPHEVWILLALALFIGGCAGWLLGHWRAYQECCDCCTCQDCEPGYEEVMPDDSGWTAPRPLEQGPVVIEPRRHAVVLEPGPTIYPALAALAEQAMDGSESHAEHTELIPWTQEPSAWLRTIRLDWETRYPIHQEAL